MFTLHGVCTWYAVRRVPSSGIFVTMAISYLFIGSTAWVVGYDIVRFRRFGRGCITRNTERINTSWRCGILRLVGGYCAVIQLVCCRCEALGSDLDPFVGVSCRCLWKKQIRHQRLVRISNENQRKNSSQTTLIVLYTPCSTRGRL
jgi:hypothetical protein